MSRVPLEGKTDYAVKGILILHTSEPKAKSVACSLFVSKQCRTVSSCVQGGMVVHGACGILLLPCVNVTSDDCHGSMAAVWLPDPLRTRHAALCSGLLGGTPAQLTTAGSGPPANEQATSCGSVTSPAVALQRNCVVANGFCKDDHRQEQERLWQQCFLDPAIWWDNRRHDKYSRSPDFRRKGADEVLRLDSMFRPAWVVDEQLLSLDTQIGHGAFASKPTSLNKSEPGRRAAWEMGVISPVTVSTLCHEGKLCEAVGALESLAQTDSAGISLSLLCTVIKLCTATKDMVVGRRLHDLTVKLGYESIAYVGNHVLRMYACGGRLEEAMDVFTRVGKPDVFTWSSIISAHAKHGRPTEAVQLYHAMRRLGVKADAHVFVAALQACAFAGDLESGRKVHCDVMRSGISTNLFVGSSLVDMYAKCDKMRDARQVFDTMATKDVVTWNALVAGYAKCGDLKRARQIFDSMNSKNVVTWNAMIAGYAKCGELKDARQVFNSMKIKNVVTWNALIAGYAQQGFGHDALVLYGQMEQDGLILADHFTFGCLLKACASTGALQKGRQLHAQIVERGLVDDVVVGTCLVDMYAKCGEVEDARQVFDSLKTKNVVTWTALIGGYGTCDEGHKALACFEEMLVAGIQPDGATFSCLLVACSHEGLVEEGRKHFLSMAEEHGIKATNEHYTCMIDLLGRAGHLDEAETMLLSCLGESDVVGLTSLLSACKNHGDLERAMWCFESIVKLDPLETPAYVLMASAYADAGRWSDVERIETQRKVAGANKKPAVATVEVKNEVHRFLVGERREDIALKVESTNTRVKQEGGHIPHTKLVLKPLPESEKEDALCGHAEKLALAFGLVNTPSGTPLLVTKNLRMCSDCHSSTEIMSRLEQRDIIVRDGYRVHRFAAGCCSCKGRW